MKKITFKGIIDIRHNDFSYLKLKQRDGYLIDLVYRFREIHSSLNGKKVQVSYWITDKPRRKQAITEEIIKSICGGISADYEKSHYSYSSWTSGCDYDTELKIGKHDLYKELLEHNGKYIVLEINIM